MDDLNNICIFINTLLSGGTEKQAILLAKSLNKIYNVWLIVYYGDKVEQKFKNLVSENQFNTVYLSGSHLQKILSFYLFLKHEKINMIFSYLLTTNLIGGVIGKFAGVKNTIGGIRSSKFSKKKEYLQKLLQNHINKRTIYNNNRGFRLLTEKGFNSEKAIIIPNCFEINTGVKIRNKKEIVTILSVGRFHKAKDYKTAIKIISKLRDTVYNFKYQIIGYGSEEENIRKWINEFSAQDYIEIIINPENLNDYYESADIYLMTSIFEGLSNTVLEAMSYSLPLVLTNVGDNDRLVEEGKNGFLCDVRDSNQIAEKLKLLIISYKKRIEYGVKSYQQLTDNYSLDKFQKNYIDFIENLKDIK